MGFSLPYALSWADMTWLACVFFGAGLVRGFSGFGLAALIMTGAALVMDPMPLVAMVVLADLVLTAQQARGIRAHIAWRRVAWLFGGCLVGVPVGVWAMGKIAPDHARIVIAVFVLCICALLLAGWKMAKPAGGPAHVATGLASGLANGAAVGGLPVAVFFAAQPVTAAAFRATNIAYFTLLDLWTLPVLAWSGQVTRATVVMTALALPFLIAGVWLGTKQFHRASPADFRRFAIVLLIALASLSLVKSLWPLAS